MQYQTWWRASSGDMAEQIDLASWEPAYTENPHPFYARLREQAPVARVVVEGLPVWLVTRYDDIRDGLADPRLSNDPELVDAVTRDPSAGAGAVRIRRGQPRPRVLHRPRSARHLARRASAPRVRPRPPLLPRRTPGAARGRDRLHHPPRRVPRSRARRRPGRARVAPQPHPARAQAPARDLHR